mmetsp:Transcript_15657/g.15787  ORF Transcript_15657/g.15787 Transcript_15657/m.15787 type:complete len:451 (+) Transcript_15657:262-1614(+)|eukprot:CAMPEP_0182430806 /NCGR_PEP_ID=MMETSP1167-20130531/43659_1 /TAXON_ID=2988 /ORGANISM="Mallomonas Sp, Strain CCMP3275" /LENGTH=450 /DNA_ID=CAMNT_0024616319 /DNA_START=244 /DNA_END=1596 /DNA_ORIENTATION=+
MHYDPRTNTLTDVETGIVVVQFQESDQLPPEYSQVRKEYLYNYHLAEQQRLTQGNGYTSASDPMIDADRRLAMQLAEQDQISPRQHVETKSQLGRTFQNIDSILSGGKPNYRNHAHPPPQEFNMSPLEAEYMNQLEAESRGVGGGRRGDIPVTNRGPSRNYDEAFARALQMMEYEIVDEMAEVRRAHGIGTDFETKELRATRCRRQMMTISTLICVAQVVLLIVMCQKEGIASREENPLYGPSAQTLVLYGAKDAYLIVEENEWWRLVTAIFSHAGVVHILFNVFVQLQIGGYLNLVYGSVYWFIIYLAGGIFGNMLSCITMPESVGVGSSGALLGMLGSWIVWIIVRWRKVPPACTGQRNCQLIIVIIAIVATLAFSFAPMVDWAAHFGGFIMGTIVGVFLLCGEYEGYCLIVCLRVISLSCCIALYAWAINYMTTELNPEDPLRYYSG